tara:strand:+ start:35 stop:448 length:414 start_codon:yes stop_codon:yes gene_type:complete
MAFKMKGHTLPGIKQRPSAKMADGRAKSSAFQKSPVKGVKVKPKQESSAEKAKGTDPVVKGRLLPTVDVSEKKLEVKNVISKDKDTGEDVYTRSKGSRSAEFVKNPDFVEGKQNRGAKRWIRRDGAKDPSGMPTGFN